MGPRSKDAASAAAEARISSIGNGAHANGRPGVVPAPVRDRRAEQGHGERLLRVVHQRHHRAVDQRAPIAVGPHQLHHSELQRVRRVEQRREVAKRPAGEILRSRVAAHRDDLADRDLPVHDPAEPPVVRGLLRAFEPVRLHLRLPGPLPCSTISSMACSADAGVRDGEQRSAAVPRIALRDLASGIAREDVVAEALDRRRDRVVELPERGVAIRLGSRPTQLRLLDPQEDVAHHVDRRPLECRVSGGSGSWCGIGPGYLGITSMPANRGPPPTADRTFAASAMCSISSRTTYLNVRNASDPWSRTESIAHWYGGIVACSTVMAHWRWRRRSARSSIAIRRWACRGARPSRAPAAAGSPCAGGRGWA